MDRRRRFNSAERVALFLAAKGRCVMCGVELTKGWHADHIIPWSAGGPTETTNGAALCPSCNMRKGFTVMTPDPRFEWQNRMMSHYFETDAHTYTINACPASGKTRAVARIARQLLNRHQVQQIIMVVPWLSLRGQTERDAYNEKLALYPDFVNADTTYDMGDFQGIVVTYQQLHNAPALFNDMTRKRNTLVVLDEIHHAFLPADESDSPEVDSKWGQSLTEAFDGAARIIATTGTLFRSKPGEKIPFIQYDKNATAIADFTYTYAEAIQNGNCRRCEFSEFDGVARWIEPHDDADPNRASRAVELSTNDRGVGLSSLYSFTGAFLRPMIKAAHQRLVSIRQSTPNAGGLLIAQSQDAAEHMVQILREVTGTTPVLAISKDPDAPKKIVDFRNATTPWIVAVNMVSEGVDIPRLAVGVWTSRTSTEMFFRQVVGRFARQGPGDHRSALYLPAVKPWTEYAQRVEDEIAHVIESKEPGPPPPEGVPRLALSPGQSELFQVVHGGEITAAQRHEDALCYCQANGIPEHLWEQVANVIDDVRSEAGRTPPPDSAESEPTPNEQRNLAKRQLDERIRQYVNGRALKYGEAPDYAAAYTRLGKNLGSPKRPVYRPSMTILQMQQGQEIVTQWMREL